LAHAVGGKPRATCRRRAALLGAVAAATVLALAAARATPRTAADGPDGGPLRGAALARVLEAGGPIAERLAPDALPTSPAPLLGEDLPAPNGYPLAFRHYPPSGQLAAFLRQLERDHPHLLEVREIGRSSLGRPILAARVANTDAPGNVTDRPAMYVDGQHHARELISQSVALYTLWRLVDAHGRDPFVTHLLDTRALYVIPSVNPDGNDIVLADYQAMRKTANPTACDDDGDGRLDEDPSAGYGYGTHTLSLYRFSQRWADEHPDDPFVGAWRNHLAPRDPIQELGRFSGAFGGPLRPVPRVDDDGDGQVDEDELGGVDANRNYAAWWSSGDPRCRSDGYRGPRVWSEPETRAVRDFVSGIGTLSTALSYHSGVDLILHPWGYSADAPLPDAWLFELLARKGSQLTEVHGFPGAPHAWTARGLYRASGSTMDYLYADHGAYAFSPEVYGSNGRTLLQRAGAGGTFTVGVSTAAVYNPPVGEILATADRWHRFALYLLAATPHVALHALGATPDEVTLQLANDGALPAVVRGELRAPSGSSTPLGPTRLAASGVTWTVPRADLPDGQLELIVSVEQPSGTRPHVIQRARWSLLLAGGALLPLDGPLPAPVDLSEQFPDGWWADERWDEPGRYHLPPDRPIAVTPPSPFPTLPAATATAATATATPSEAPPTPTPTAATATPTAAPPTVTPTPPTPTAAASATTLVTATAVAPASPTGTATVEATPTAPATAAPTARHARYLPWTWAAARRP